MSSGWTGTAAAATPLRRRRSSSLLPRCVGLASPFRFVGARARASRVGGSVGCVCGDLAPAPCCCCGGGGGGGGGAATVPLLVFAAGRNSARSVFDGRVIVRRLVCESLEHGRHGDCVETLVSGSLLNFTTHGWTPLGFHGAVGIVRSHLV
jgi:hypothetical protein